MPRTPHEFGPRKDFPVRRLIETLILGNMVFAGGNFLLIVAAALVEGLVYGTVESPRDFAEALNSGLEQIISSSFGSPEAVALMLTFGTFCGVIWYWIARHFETRRLKKRFGILTKSCTSLKADVKSPHS